MDDYFYQSTTEVCKDVAEQKAKDKIEELKKNPNNYVYDYTYKVTKNVLEHRAEQKVFKRRQRTKQGAEQPISVKDDRGVPLFVTPSGEVTTDGRGNEPYWGNWYEATELGSMYNGAEYAIEQDKQVHLAQQLRKAYRIQVEYKTETVKDAWKEYSYTANIQRVKARELPTELAETKYHIPKVTEDTKYAAEVAVKVIQYEYEPDGKRCKKTRSVGENRHTTRSIMDAAHKSQLLALKTVESRIGLLNFEGKADRLSFSYSPNHYYKEIQDGYIANITIHRLNDNIHYIGAKQLLCTIEVSITKGQVLNIAPQTVVKTAHEWFNTITKDAHVKLHFIYDATKFGHDDNDR